MDELLKGLYLLKGATREDVGAVAGIAKAHPCAAQEVLFTEDHPPQAMYLIRTGHMEVFKGDTSLAKIGPRDVVGELAFFDGAARSASVRALEPSELLELPYADLRRVMEKRPSLALVVFRNACTAMATRLRQTSADFTWLNVYVRL